MTTNSSPKAGSEKSASDILRLNYLVHCIEGGLVGGGMAFIAADTIAPPLLKSLNAPAWVISFMPIFFSLGIVGPSLFVAHYVEHLTRLKPLVMWTGFLSRSLYLVAGLVLLFGARSKPAMAIAVIVCTQFLSGLCSGLSFAAWQSLVAKTVPHEKLSSIWATRNVLIALIGIGAGGIIAWILGSYQGLEGYGILYLAAFGLTMGSLAVLSLLHEPPHVPVEAHKRLTLNQNLRRIPGLVRGDKRLSRYLLTTACMNGSIIMIPFMSIHALQVTNASSAFLGFIVSAQMIGGIAGNITAGYLGNRLGGKPAMILGRIVFVAAGLLTVWARSEAAFLAAFCLYGMAISFNSVGGSTMNISLSPQRDRATYLSIMSVVTVPSMLLASGLSTVLWSLTHQFGLMAAVALSLVASSLFFLLRIDERAQEVRLKGVDTAPAAGAL